MGGIEQALVLETEARVGRLRELLEALLPRSVAHRCDLPLSLSLQYRNTFLSITLSSFPLSFSLAWTNE